MKVKRNEKKSLELNEKGSIELIAIGLLAALIIVLAIPYLSDIGTQTQTHLDSLNSTL